MCLLGEVEKKKKEEAVNWLIKRHREGGKRLMIMSFHQAERGKGELPTGVP